MNRQKGQSAVEFALIVPLFLILILGMIYGGFAYADYLQYSTAVREAARDIAVQKPAKREILITGLNSNSASVVEHYASPLTKLYQAEFSAELKKEENEPRFVTVKVTLTRAADVSILPEKLAPLQCTMPLEKESSET